MSVQSYITSITNARNTIRTKLVSFGLAANDSKLAALATAISNISGRAAQTITPGTSDQEIGAGVYLTGKQTIKGDPNLLAQYIKKGITIFGVTGTYDPLDSEGGIRLEDTSGNAWYIPRGDGTSGDVNLEDEFGTTYYIPQDNTSDS